MRTSASYPLHGAFIYRKLGRPDQLHQRQGRDPIIQTPAHTKAMIHGRSVLVINPIRRRKMTIWIRAFFKGHEESDSFPNIFSFHSRSMGPPHVDLQSINTDKKRFYKLMSHHSYQLMITTDTCSSRATAGFKVHIKVLNLTLKNNTFYGKDWTRVFHFLFSFQNEADMLNMSDK